jgi:hypothetical protein
LFVFVERAQLFGWLNSQAATGFSLCFTPIGFSTNQHSASEQSSWLLTAK